MAELISQGVINDVAITGCPDPTSGQAIVLPAGPGTNYTTVFKDSNGQPIDLSAYAAEPAGIKAYITNALCTQATIYEATATFLDATTGKITVNIPSDISNYPGIYRAEIWVGSDITVDPPIFVYRDTQLISIEQSLYSRTITGSNVMGPLTINEIRLQLRDFPELNEYWRRNEFSVAEMVHSMLQPIYTWNETPPPIAKHTAATFPFRQQWLEATSANLMKTAAAWLLRNHRTLKYADGTTETDKDKYSQYLAIAEQKWAKYEQFCFSQKVAINLNSRPGVHGINY